MRTTAIILATVYLVALVAMIYGWVLNLIFVISMAMHSAPLDGEFALRIVGLFFAPLGAILGWLS